MLKKIHPISEYENLDSTLDQLDSLLDHLEQKNEALVVKLRDLLETNKETTAEMQSLNNATESCDLAETDGSDDTEKHKPTDQ